MLVLKPTHVVTHSVTHSSIILFITLQSVTSGMVGQIEMKPIPLHTIPSFFENFKFQSCIKHRNSLNATYTTIMDLFMSSYKGPHFYS